MNKLLKKGTHTRNSVVIRSVMWNIRVNRDEKKGKQEQTISGREWALIIVARAYCLLACPSSPAPMAAARDRRHRPGEDARASTTGRYRGVWCVEAYNSQPWDEWAGVLGLAVQVGSSLVTDLLLETLGPKKGCVPTRLTGRRCVAAE